MSISRQTHPILYRLNVERHRLLRRLSLRFGGARFAKVDGRQRESTAIRTFRHKSVLMRQLGDVDMRLQRNKITNLRLAAERINDTVIRPGETFSLWRLVGRPTARRGFLTGLLLSQGEVTEGVGGGLCQMANLLYWMFLHSPLTVTERHHHSFDAFPDSGRTLPFGSGATIFYNYVDLQAQNLTERAFRLSTWVDDRFLHGELWADEDLAFSYRILERNHRFMRDNIGTPWYRENDLFRQVIDRRTGLVVEEQHLMHNRSEVKYDFEKNAVAPDFEHNCLVS
ncbi:MAG: VanW family protein [Patescibacteria group bacterium]